MNDIEKSPSLNVFGKALLPISDDSLPVIAYYKGGCCDGYALNDESHIICVEVTQKFLSYARLRGNDLTTPVPEIGYPGLKVDQRCGLCATRWLKADESNMAPPVFLQRTNKAVLDIVPMELLAGYAIDMP